MRPHRRWATGLIAGASLVIAAIGVGLVAWAERDSVEAINGRLETLAPWLLFWRFSLFAILIAYWRELAGWITTVFTLDAESGKALVRWRWRATAGLLSMDLVLVEDLIGKLQHVLA